MLKLILLIVFLHEGLCASIFDYTEFDDPYSFFFQRPLVIRQHHGRCLTSVNGQNQEGICLTRPECTATGGRAQGRDGCFLGTCCVYSRGCNQRSSKRISYFDYSGTLAGIDACDYTVIVENNNICQMRIDFESLNLRAPRQELIANVPVEGSPYECRDEIFQIQSPNYRGIPALCGNNNGQHMYINVNASAGQRHLVMRVVPDTSTDDTGSSTTTTYSWRIKVTQLECPGVYKQKTQRTWEDYPLLAPNGCLQYFVENQGEVRNFGFQRIANGIVNHYTSNLDYSICFRRTTDMCGVRFQVDYFSLSGDPAPATDATTAGFCMISQDAGGTAILRDGDYLLIPDGKFTGTDPNDPTLTTTTVRDRYCGTAMTTNTIIVSQTSGPFYIRFRTDDRVSVDPNNGGGTEVTDTENGFQLRYALLRGNACS